MLLQKQKKKHLWNIGQIVLDIGWVQSAEAIGIADSYFYIIRIHLPLEAFLQRENRRVDGIVQLQIFAVTLLQEGLPVDGILAHGGSLPRKVRSGRIALEQIGTAFIPTADQQRHPERTDTPAIELSRYFHNSSRNRKI